MLSRRQAIKAIGAAAAAGPALIASFADDRPRFKGIPINYVTRLGSYQELKRRKEQQMWAAMAKGMEDRFWGPP